MDMYVFITSYIEYPIYIIQSKSIKMFYFSPSKVYAASLFHPPVLFEFPAYKAEERFDR